MIMVTLYEIELYSSEIKQRFLVLSIREKMKVKKIVVYIILHGLLRWFYFNTKFMHYDVSIRKQRF